MSAAPDGPARELERVHVARGGAGGCRSGPTSYERDCSARPSRGNAAATQFKFRASS